MKLKNFLKYFSTKTNLFILLICACAISFSIFFFNGNYFVEKGIIANHLTSNLYIKSLPFTILIIGIFIFIKSNDDYHILLIFSTVFLICGILIFKNNNLFYDLGGDHWYLNALVTKNKYYFDWNIDSTIKGIPSYIAPLYFFILGKISFLFNINSHNILLASSFVSLLLMPFLYYLCLRKSFDLFTVTLSVLIGCVFFEYEIILKPYQSLSALLALYFYYKIIPKLEDNPSRNEIIKFSVFGVFLFLTYYYHFIYLGIAFFLSYYFTTHILKNNSAKLFNKTFVVYCIIFVVGFTTFFLPNIVSAIISGNNHKIFHGATDKLELDIFLFPIVLGVINILRNIEREISYKTMILILSLTVLFVLNIFLELYLDFNIHIFKIKHILGIILLPHMLDEILSFIKNNLKPNDINYRLARIFIYSTLLFFVTDSWIVKCLANKPNSNQYKFWSEIAEHTKSKINLKDKVIFFPTYNSDIEYGSYIPNYRFLPVNIDFGSPGSNIKNRILLMEKLDSVKNNPAAFFNVLVNQNKFEQIDYVLWNNEINKFSWQTLPSMGVEQQTVERPGNIKTLSKKYFSIAHPEVKYLYKINLKNNFLNKNQNELTYLEKVALNKLNGNSYPILQSEVLKNINLYKSDDINDIIYYMENNQSFTADDITNFSNCLPSGLVKSLTIYSFEVEQLPTSINDYNNVVIGKYASGGYARRGIPSNTPYKSGNTLSFGPYVRLAKGKYELKVFIKSNVENEYDAINMDIFSGSSNKTFLTHSFKNKEIFSNDNYTEQKFVFELLEDTDSIEVRFFYNEKVKSTIEVDKFVISLI